jgi:hypothetical protein
VITAQVAKLLLSKLLRAIIDQMFPAIAGFDLPMKKPAGLRRRVGTQILETPIGEKAIAGWLKNVSARFIFR